jgi:hypothetical protein
MPSPIIGTYGHGTENDFVLIYDPENSDLHFALTDSSYL